MRKPALAATAALLAITPVVAASSASAQDTYDTATAPAEDDDDIPGPVGSWDCGPWE